MKFTKALSTLALLLLIIFSPSKISSQNYYEDSFPYLKDTVFYPGIDSTLNAYKYDSVIYFAEDAYSYYYNKGETDRANYIFNICCYYPLAIGNTDLVLPIVNAKLDFLRHNTDTNNVHFATLNQIASFGYKYDGKFGKAKPYMENAIRIYESTPTPLLHKSSGYYNLGGILLSSDDFYGAYKLYMKALEGFNSIYDSISPNFEYYRKHDVATSYIGIAFGMKATGQIILSEAFNHKAYNTLIEYPRSDLLAICEANLSSNYINLEDYNKAIYYADSALSFLTDKNSKLLLNDVYVSSLKSLGIANSKINQDSNIGLNYLKTASNFLHNNFPDDSLRISLLHSEIASIYYDMNNVDSSSANFNVAINYAPSDPLVNINFAQTQLKMGDYNKAISVLKNITIDNNSNFINKKINIETNTYLAKSYLKKYDDTNNLTDIETSLRYAKKSNSLIINHLNNTIFGENDLKLANDFHNIAEIAINASYILYQQTGDQNYLNDFIQFISQSTSNKLNIEIGHLHNKSKYTSSSKQIDLLQNIRILENKLQALSESDNNDTYNKILEKLTAMRIEAFELSYSLQETNKESTSIIYNDNIDLKNVEQLLSSNEALIQFFIATDGIYSSIIRNNKTDIFFTKTSEITDLVVNYNKSLKIGGNHFYDAANKLYEVLFGKLHHNLTNITKLIIIPDGILNQIPMEPMVTDTKTKKILLNDYSIVYNYSLYIWIKNRNTTFSSPTSFVGFAPIFDDTDNNIDIAFNDPFVIGEYPILRSGKKLVPLPFSGTEVETVAHMFDVNGYNSSIFLNENATEENFKKNINNKSIIHIATHGFSSTTYPELSCLYLSPNNDPNNLTNDGKTYVGEIFTMSPSADLVVLSACKSGTGKIVKGEGVMSLPRAFLFAGIPNIISSLWKIHDKKTMTLMVDFYEELLSGKNYADALRIAKLKQIENGELTINWGGIILIGE